MREKPTPDRRSGREELMRYLTENGDRDIERLLEKFLSTLRPDSFRKVLNGVNELIGGSGGDYLLNEILFPQDEEIRSQKEGREAPPGSEESILHMKSTLRRLRSLYRPQLARAYGWWGSDVNEWFNFRREVLWDKIAETWLIEIRIEKYSGESITFRSSSDSTARLCSYLLKTLEMLPPGEIPEEEIGDMLPIASSLGKQPKDDPQSTVSTS